MHVVKNGDITRELVDDDCHNLRMATVQPASAEAVAYILAADENSEDGRSEWLWVRLPNGDLLLATFPQGDTYFAWEGERKI